MKLKRSPEELQREREENRKENIVAFLVTLAVFFVVGWWLYHSVNTQPEQGTIPLPVGTSPTIGDGPVTVVEFSDFECPFCREFALTVFPDVRKRLVETGRVRFVFKHFPLTQVHLKSQQAAEAAACAADQDKFWEYHDLLYEHQDALEIGQLLSYAGELGMDTSVFADCLKTGLRRQDVVNDKSLGLRSGVTGTPTFFFNGRRVVGFLSFEDFSKEVERETRD